jgi:hypothetical protein
MRSCCCMHPDKPNCRMDGRTKARDEEKAADRSMQVQMLHTRMHIDHSREYVPTYAIFFAKRIWSYFLTTSSVLFYLSTMISLFYVIWRLLIYWFGEQYEDAISLAHSIQQLAKKYCMIDIYTRTVELALVLHCRMHCGWFMEWTQWTGDDMTEN